MSMDRRWGVAAVAALWGCTDADHEEPLPWAGTEGAVETGVFDASTASDADADGTTGDDGPSSESTGSAAGESGGDEPEHPGPAGTCGPGASTSGIVQVNLDAQRFYFVGVPNAEGPLPMVVAFHGDEGHPSEAVRWYWEPVWSSHQSFVLVMMKCPGCTSWYQGDTGPNVQYVWDVLADVAGEYDVDVSRVYAIGYSGGSSFLSMHGLEFQEVFAGIQWHCGGGWGPYAPPPREDCKVDARFVISEDDFLWDNAKAMESLLLNNGHHVDFVVAQCSGHCCPTADLAEGAWAWFQQRTKCDDVVGGECDDLTALP
jgi:predicted esterase